MKCTDCGYPYVSNTSGHCRNCGHENMTVWGWIKFIIVIVVISKFAEMCGCLKN